MLAVHGAHYFDRLNLCNSNFRRILCCCLCCYGHRACPIRMDCVDVVSVANGVNGRQIHDVGHPDYRWDEVVLVGVDYFAAMMAEHDYCDYLDSLQNNVHDLSYRIQTRLC